MDILSRQKIIDMLQKSGPKLESFGIQRIGIFGSFAKEQARQDSDIDILVEFDSDNNTFDNFMDTCFFLEDLLGRNVELVTKNSLSPYIGPHILEEVQYVTLTN